MVLSNTVAAPIFWFCRSHWLLFNAGSLTFPGCSEGMVRTWVLVARLLWFHHFSWLLYEVGSLI
jgi:hypothetical protein